MKASAHDKMNQMLKTALVVSAVIVLEACSPYQASTKFSTVITSVDSASVSQPGDTDNPILNPVTTPADTTVATCNSMILSKLKDINTTQMQWYSARGFAQPVQAKRTQFLAGDTGRVAIVVHGYNSSPADTSDIATVLNSNGYTVVSPLITGFASDANAANASDVSTWRPALVNAINAVKSCATNITLVGHSLGGALVTDQLLNQGLTGISTAIVLAPAYQSRTPAFDTALSYIINAGFDTISTKSFKEKTGFDPFTYLPFLKTVAGGDDITMPLKAAQAVVAFEKELTNNAGNSSVPIMVVVSQADTVISADYALDFVPKHFSTVKSTNYPLIDAITHFLENRSYNKHFDVMTADMLDLMNAH